MKDSAKIKLARLLAFRLERISADSVWAHRSSGVRGSILKLIDGKTDGLTPWEGKLINDLISKASFLLEQAGKEILK
ncbi:MAG: hypothetical protein ACK2TS_06635 [Anaerolineales bacterium]